VWSLIGNFGADWHPLVANIRLTGTGIGQLRTMQLVDGSEIIQQLEAIDDAGRSFRYTNIAGVPVSHYTGTLEVTPKGSGSVVEWRAQYLASNRPDGAVKRMVAPLLKTGLEHLRSRFGAAK
jgi:hypothetical protein